MKKTESAPGFRTGSSKGIERPKRERQQVQRLREQREGRHGSGCEAPVEGRCTAGVCRHPGEAKGVKAPHPSYGDQGQRPKRWHRDPGGLRGEQQYGSAKVHTSGVKRQHHGARAGLTSMGGGMPATRRPKKVRRRSCRAQEWPALCGRSQYWPGGSHTESTVGNGMPHEAHPHLGGQNRRPDLMRRPLVLVEYGWRSNGTGLLCWMRWACGAALHGVKTESGLWNTARGDMGCLLHALGLQGSLLGYVGHMGSSIFPATRGCACVGHQLSSYQLTPHHHINPQMLPQTSLHCKAHSPHSFCGMIEAFVGDYGGSK